MSPSNFTGRPWEGTARQFQHHVPQLLLNEWANEAGKVIRFYEPVPGKLIASPSAVKSTAGQENTYTVNTFFRAARDFDDIDENGNKKVQQCHLFEYLLSRGIDSTYSKLAIDRFTREHDKITIDDKEQLISLIMSFRARHPAFIAQLEAKYRDVIISKYNEFAEIVGTPDYSNPKQLEQTAKRIALLMKERNTIRELNPHLYEAMEIMTDKSRREYLMGLKFGTVQIHGPRRAVISDVPVYEADTRLEPFELFIPLTPEHVLFLFDESREQEFSDFVSYENLIETVNVKMASQSVDAVYAINTDEADLMKTFFAAKYKFGPKSKFLTGMR